eukprot:TRINITY_DN2399_c0_g1_i1.p1 TRINITY_DN2399_c0_g1~~TRINITY_DN2399_c0_g1_i1.p1  ORF type:complete len:559 (-),score=133.18 TRINITY_DN2399_c0_g1_i1:69-1661(-)
MSSFSVRILLLALVCLSASAHGFDRARLQRDLESLQRDLDRDGDHEHQHVRRSSDDEVFAETGASSQVGVKGIQVRGTAKKVCKTDNLKVNVQAAPDKAIRVAWSGHGSHTYTLDTKSAKAPYSGNIEIPHTDLPNSAGKHSFTLTSGTEGIAHEVTIEVPDYKFVAASTGDCERVRIRASAKCGSSQLEYKIRVMNSNGVAVHTSPVLKGSGGIDLLIKHRPNPRVEIEPGLYRMEIVAHPDGNRVAAHPNPQGVGYHAGFINVGGRARTLDSVKDWVNQGHDSPNELDQISAAARQCLRAGESSVPLVVGACRVAKARVQYKCDKSTKSACNAHTEDRKVRCVWTQNKCHLKDEYTDVRRTIKFAISGGDNPNLPNFITQERGTHAHYSTNAITKDGVNWGGVYYGAAGLCSNGKPIDGDMILWRETLLMKKSCEDGGGRYTANYFIDRPFCDCCAHFFLSKHVIDPKGHVKPPFDYWLRMFVGSQSAARIGQSAMRAGAHGTQVRRSNMAGTSGWPSEFKNVLGGRN